MENSNQQKSGDGYFSGSEQEVKKEGKVGDMFLELDDLEIDKPKKPNRYKGNRANLYERAIIILFIIIGIISIFCKPPFSITIIGVFILSFSAGFLSKKLSLILNILSSIFTFIYFVTVEINKNNGFLFLEVFLIPLACGLGLLLGHIITWIITSIRCVIKGEVNRKNVGRTIFKRTVIIFIVGVLLWACIKYDISPEKYPILRILS